MSELEFRQKEEFLKKSLLIIYYLPNALCSALYKLYHLTEV